jgi:hypothetical protein
VKGVFGLVGFTGAFGLWTLTMGLWLFVTCMGRKAMVRKF